MEWDSVALCRNKLPKNKIKGVDLNTALKILLLLALFYFALRAFIGAQPGWERKKNLEEEAEAATEANYWEQGAHVIPSRLSTRCCVCVEGERVLPF